MLEAKLARLRAFMAQNQLGALLLGRQENFAWLTGARGHIGIATEISAAWVLVTVTDATVIANAIEAPRMEREELAGLGLPMAVHPWHDDAARTRLVQELAGGAPLGADIPFPGALAAGPALAPLRWTLLPQEQAHARTMGRAVAEALEATCRAIQPGQTEFQIAGELARQTLSREMDPVVNLVATDERTLHCRHPLPTGRRLERYAMVVLCARQRGLVLSATRLVHFGSVPADLARRLEACARVDAAAIGATRPGTPIAAVWEKIVTTYTEAGFAGEWEKHHQGGLAGYLSREYRAMPGSTQVVEAGQLFAWNPTIAGVKSEDTILTTEAGPEILTATGTWPMLTVTVAGQTLARPGFLER